MIRTYTMRLKATKRQATTLTDLLEHLCVLYNSALEWRKRSWEQDEKSVNYYEQQKALASFRSSPEVGVFPAAIQRDPLRRVDLAFKAFFRRVKSKENPGYPRFKAKSQYDSFTVDSQNFHVDGDKIIIVKLGGFGFKTGYKIKGDPKVMHVRRCGKKWTAAMVCDIGEAPSKIAIRNAVGIDVGLTTLVTLSNGIEIENPRWTKQEEDRLAEANRSLSRKKKGSNNRVKAREHLRRVHQRIAGLRSSYLTGVAKKLVTEYDLIAHEKLNIRGMAQSRFAKSILDAAWAQLVFKLDSEAEKAGKWMVPVDPRGTTQTCSGCGERVLKELKDRWHSCPHCGMCLSRDENAARNVLALGESAASKQNYVLATERESCI